MTVHAPRPAAAGVTDHGPMAMLFRYGPALLALLLLLPPVFALAPVPIDETRYVAVAWHMHLSGDWLVPHLNGHPYSDKPPLLFWLLNAIWSVTGISAWGARLLAVLVTLANLALVRRLALRLDQGRRGTADAAAWVWLGSAAVAAFANAIMFDLLLSIFSLLMWLAALDLHEGRTGRGVLLGGAAAGLGILAKGPVILLVGGMPLLFAPAWSAAVRARWGRHALAVLAVIAIGAGLGLAWALPAAHAGGPAYENALLFRQTLGRVADSFAHERPWWWYLPVLPAMALPWVLALGRVRCRDAPSAGPVLVRFCIAAFVPAFLAFCLISGKQPHYLLPLLPALAVLLGQRLASGRWIVSDRRAGLVMTALGVGVVMLTRRIVVGHGGEMAGLMWAGGVIMLGLWLMIRGRRTVSPRAAALAMLATVMAAKLAAVATGGLRFDMGPASHLLAQAQAEHRPLLFLGRHNAAFDFAGRLKQPVPQGRPADVSAWVQAHPNGWVLTYVRRFELPLPPMYRQPFLNRQLMIWRARDILAAERAGHLSR